MYQVDISVTQAINDLAGKSPAMDFLMIWASAIGVPIAVAAVALQWWRPVNRLHIRHVIVAAGLSFLVGLGLNQLILLGVHRVRPYDAGITHLLIAKSADPSFPSDHATATVAIAATFLFHRMHRIGLWFSAGALLVMFSRIYLGIHYASDVLGGALTGLLGALIVLALYREGTRVDRAVTAIL